MKTVILITVIETLAITLAILYFCYKRNQSGKRALVLRHQHVIVGGAPLFSTSKLKRMALHCRSDEQTVKARTLKSKK
jgi:hypothetical protein